MSDEIFGANHIFWAEITDSSIQYWENQLRNGLVGLKLFAQDVYSGFTFAKLAWCARDLICLSSISPEGAGTLVLVSVVPSTPLHFFSFSIFPPTLFWSWKRTGVKEKTLCIGEPLPIFFLCFYLVIFKQIVFRVALLKFV